MIKLKRSFVFSVQLWTDFNFDIFLTLSDENQKSAEVQIICLLPGNDTVSKCSTKECANLRTVAFIPHASKVMLKILYAIFQPYVNQELPYVQAGFRKGRRTRDQIATICCIIEKGREFQKNIYHCFIDYTKAFDCLEHSKLWKAVKEMGIPDHLRCLLRNLYSRQEATVRTCMEQLIGSRSRKEYCKPVCCHPF